MASKIEQNVISPAKPNAFTSDEAPNGVFVMPQADPGSKSVSWRPARDGEIPVWGWVVINHANHCIQIFLPDGTFYREVRLGGDATTSDQWLPFEPPTDNSQFDKPKMHQLQLLVRELDDRDYLQQFFDMVNDATSSMKPSPNAYDEFTGTLIGRPVALVNAGWSLELATDAQGAQADEKLPQDSKHPLHDINSREDKTLYSFPFRLGDRQRGFDGLVGFFDLRKNPTESDALELGTIYSHFARQGEMSKPGSGVPYRVVDACTYCKTEGSTGGDSKVDVNKYAQQRNSHLSVFGLILEPFSAVHASGTLPVNELAPWTWQSAIKKMKAFFHVGPLLTARDVPDFDSQRKSGSDKPPTPFEDEAKENFKLPNLSGADWAWLQPCTEEKGEKPEEPGLDREKFMSLPIQVEDERDKFESGPYTAVEGYLMMNER